LGQLTVS